MSKSLFTILGCAILAFALLSSVVAENKVPKDPSVPIKNVHFQGAEIRSVLTFLADYGNVNVVVSPDVSGSVTIKLTDINWRVAMDIIGKTYNLAVVDDGEGYIRVLSADSYRTELSEIAKHENEQIKLIPLETKIIKISNSVAGDLVETVEGLLTERGGVKADDRSNKLIIQDVPSVLTTVIGYIDELDKPSRQIKISAQLIEISSKYLEEIGLDWTATGNYTSESGRVSTQTARVSAPLDSDFAGRYSVNIPGNGWNLNSFVEALITNGKGKIVAHPEITTVENTEARIQMGQKVPVKQFDESGNVVIKFEEVGTILVVTPHITAENQILMNLRPERSTYQFDPNGVIINTNNAETNVIVGNGQTAVIGGLTTQDEINSEVGVPILKDIPIFGRLFKYTQTRTENRDLVIFVTPTIVDVELALNE